MKCDRTQVAMLCLDIAECTAMAIRLKESAEAATDAMVEFSLAVRSIDAAAMDEAATEDRLAGFQPYIL